MKLYIQNMVSLRCKMLVMAELDKLGKQYSNVQLGEVEINEMFSDEETLLFKAALHRGGLELMDDANAIIIEQIKNIIIEMIHYSDDYDYVKINFSDYISKKLDKDYHKLSEIFSRTKGVTIEHFIIVHKIERVKELLMYDQLNLSEIAWKMHYSSVAHLSNQFKKITGLTPSFFKALKNRSRQPLEDL